MMLISVVCFFLVSCINGTRFCTCGLCSLVHIELEVLLHGKANNDPCASLLALPLGELVSWGNGLQPG